MKKLSQQELLDKIEKLKKSGGVDLSLEEDLSIAIMNLVSLEEHFFFTAAKTGNDDYLALLEQTRQIRKELLGKVIDRHEGETWCIAKHLLAASMRLIEVGTKLQSAGQAAEAKERFNQAFEIYSLFWAVRLKLIDLASVKKIPDDVLSAQDREAGRPWTKEEIVKKLVDCCGE